MDSSKNDDLYAQALGLGRMDVVVAMEKRDKYSPPLEGVKESPFGYPARRWAVHMAFDKREEALVEAMMRSDPRCASLPDSDGRTLMQKAFELAESKDPDREFGSKMAALAERTTIAGEAKSPAAARARSL